MSDYNWYKRSRKYNYGDYKIINGKGLYYNEDSNKWVNRLNKKVIEEKYIRYEFSIYDDRDIERDFGWEYIDRVGKFIFLLYKSGLEIERLRGDRFVYVDRNNVVKGILGSKYKEVIDKLRDEIGIIDLRFGKGKYGKVKVDYRLRDEFFNKECYRRIVFIRNSRLIRFLDNWYGKEVLSDKYLNYDYPDASYDRRKEIIEEHKNYQMGLLWFVANDPRVPADIRERLSQWGLAKDEFVDSENWPHQIYVREARRMIGNYVTTEQDVLLKREVPQPVGMGSYAMDSHNVQRYITPEGFVQNEGDIGVKPPAPYSISYGSLVPKKNQCSNLLVPVCVSSSHIAFGSIRMEPVFMILGQSAASAACLAIDNEQAVQDVNYSDLESLMLKKGQVLTLKHLIK